MTDKEVIFEIIRNTYKNLDDISPIWFIPVVLPQKTLDEVIEILNAMAETLQNNTYDLETPADVKETEAFLEMYRQFLRDVRALKLFKLINEFNDARCNRCAQRR